ncbi:amidohydrolase family protein [Paenibacillus aceti]|uniref:Amidohydrolase-related domain-containing protein n=1 Tax=Paenibacillus aceti TaxID=1820010 RepID=A0ABQ1W429_9BACL|nr:amidohydrolase family protein [Paenibacillus aceti]GGG11455.1 hypothetical protein GCM10010913_36600 [Paenibacillus aceti]
MHKIIDVHSHLGDIFAYERNVIYKKGVKVSPDKHNPFDSYSDLGFEGPFLDPSKPEQVQNVIDMTKEVSYANTLEKFQEDMAEAQVDYVCLLPVPPYINFADYWAASLIEPRIIPFTGVDWSCHDPEGQKRQIIEDYKHGAKGLKIHPILQNINLRNPVVEDVLNAWSFTDLPVIIHTGVNSYYPEDDELFQTQNPQNGDVLDFIYLAKKMPHVKFIAAHCGGLAGGEMEILANAYAGQENLWVDTTFRNAAEMREMVRLFGEDRVLFGVDRPFGKTSSSVNVAFEAFGKGTSLSEKVMYSNTAKLIKMI